MVDRQKEKKKKKGKAGEGGGHGAHTDRHGHVPHVRLTKGQMSELGIQVATAKPGRLEVHLELSGEIVLNSDRLVHVVPKVAGLVRQVAVSVGDTVEEGEFMASLDSRELSDAKAAFLTASVRKRLAWTEHQRERRLWKKGVTSKKEYLSAKKALAAAQIETRAAKQKLYALGLTKKAVAALSKHPGRRYTRFTVRAPQGGTIIAKHMVRGESVQAHETVFSIADLSTVWVDLTVYQKDLAKIRSGQKVTIHGGHGVPRASGTIAWVSPLMDPSTRTGTARVVLNNPEGSFRPGLFVTGRVEVADVEATLVVPHNARIGLRGRRVVFVQTPKGFAPRPVEIGRKDHKQAEILQGLSPGERYAFGNILVLKAEVERGVLEHAGHSH